MTSASRVKVVNSSSGNEVCHTAGQMAVSHITQTRRGPAVGAGVLLGALVAPTTLGNTAPAVAFSAIGADFGIQVAGVSWVLAAFAIATGLGVATFGRVSDSHGLHRCLLLGAVFMLAGTAIVVMAQNYGVLLVGRAVQGFGGGAIPIVSFSAVAIRFAGERRAATMGLVVALLSVTAGLGPLVGGVLEDLGGWRAVLALPALFLLVAPFVASRLPVADHATPRPLDAGGIAAVALAVTGVTVALQAPAAGFGFAFVSAGASVGALGVALTVWRARIRPEGFMPRPIIGSSRFRLCTAVGFTLFAANLATLISVSLLLNNSFGHTPVVTGALLAAASLPGVVATMVASRLLARYGLGALTTAMSVVATFGMLLGGVFVTSEVAVLLAYVLVIIGFGVAQVILLDAVPRVVPQVWQSSSTGLFNLLFVVGAGFGSAMAGGIAESWSPRAALLSLALLPAGGVLFALRLRAKNTRSAEPMEL
ncbi:MAG: MFS transporter [Thermoleophilia bacterium]|nr:MFS transporter [Thermoleophilia bacterium]